MLEVVLGLGVGLLQLITLQTQWLIPSYSGVDSASVIDINTIEIDGW
jgi:hypothetical protein